MINMKADVVDRSNIFGLTKDNHFNAVCLVLERVAFRLSQSITPPTTHTRTHARTHTPLRLCSKCFVETVLLSLPLWRSAGTQQLLREEVECIPSPLP